MPQRTEPTKKSRFDRLYEWKSRRSSATVTVHQSSSPPHGNSPRGLAAPQTRIPRSRLLHNDSDQSSFTRIGFSPRNKNVHDQPKSEKPTVPLNKPIAPLQHSEDKNPLVVETCEQKEGIFDDYSASIPIETENEASSQSIANVHQVTQSLNQKSPEQTCNEVVLEKQTPNTYSTAKILTCVCAQMAVVAELLVASVQGPQIANVDNLLEPAVDVEKLSGDVEGQQLTHLLDMEPLSAPCASEIAESIHRDLETPEGEALDEQQRAEENIKAQHSSQESLELKQSTSNTDTNGTSLTILPPGEPVRWISNINEQMVCLLTNYNLKYILHSVECLTFGSDHYNFLVKIRETLKNR